MKQNGKVIASGYGTYEKSSDAQFVSITSDVAGKNFVQEEYSDSSVKIKSDGINYTEKSRKEKHHGNEQLTPNMIKLAEMTADLFVGDLSNQFTMSGNTVSVTLTDVHIDEVLENLELAQYKNESVGKFSMGMKQCLGFASAILHKPELLILDEPTNGLDIKGTVRVRSMLKSYQAEGGTVLISSHIASEIQDYYLHIVNEKEKAK